MSISLSFRNEIIYQILIDRFSGVDTTKDWQQPSFMGGNIRGIIEKLPYLKDLGITTLWISPFYKTSMYHGYHITDFFQVDPHFGTLSDLQHLIKKTHQQNMKIIADFVPNHCSHLHPFFIDAQKNHRSIYRKWFYFKKWPKNYLCFLSFPELPKFNLSYEPAYRYIVQAATYWLHVGLDGYRLDHVIGPSHQFWKRFTQEIKQMHPSCVLLGEAWMQGISYKELETIQIPWKRWHWMKGGASDSLLKSYAGILDGVLDFQSQKIISNALCTKKPMDRRTIQKRLIHHLKKYPTGYLLPQFLDNHDMDRFLFQCHQNKKTFAEAVCLQFSLPQPAIMYYGSEKGMSQQASVWSRLHHGDILARQPMQWNYKDNEIRDIYKTNIKLKKERVNNNINL